VRRSIEDVRKFCILTRMGGLTSLGCANDFLGIKESSEAWEQTSLESLAHLLQRSMIEVSLGLRLSTMLRTDMSQAGAEIASRCHLGMVDAGRCGRKESFAKNRLSCFSSEII
jgi:hypothetical protein